MADTVKTEIPNYTMKLRIYPSAAQAHKIDEIFRALHIAYNITFHEVFQLNPMVCRPGKDDNVWPDFKKMAKKEWRAYLISQNELVEKAPSASLTTNNGLFLLDAQRAWKTGMNNRPVNHALRKEFRFYNREKPRRSYMVQLEAKRIVPSEDNDKVAWVTLPKIDGKIKARGFNRKLWFGDGGCHTYAEALQNGELAKDLSVRVSKDNCGSYYISITFSAGKKGERKLFLESSASTEQQPIGIDVGIKDVAILSTGRKIENKRFKKEQDATLRRLSRKLSRRWGSANPAFRDYNKEIRIENNRPECETPIPLAQPSKRYLATQHQRALIERRIARRRDTYYHQQTALLIREANLLAVETLRVKNMLRNHKLAYALADAAMSDFISKLKYKAERYSVEIIPIGMFEPTSQLCSVCGAQNPDVKNLRIRNWQCPECGTKHDRDINAAKNILAAALHGGKTTDPELPPETKPRPSPGSRPRKDYRLISEAYPNIIVKYSKELTKLNDPRYVIIDQQTGKIIDDAQGSGYRSMTNAKNCFKAKKKYTMTA